MSIKWFNLNDVIAQNLRLTWGAIAEEHNTFPGWPEYRKRCIRVWFVLYLFISSEQLLSQLLPFHIQMKHFGKECFEWSLIAIDQLKLELKKNTGFSPFTERLMQDFFLFMEKITPCHRNGAESKKTLSFTKFSELYSCYGVCPAQWSPRRQYSFD